MTVDLVVLGAGPGGYVAALRAAQLGMRVACVEKEDRLGGTCLRVGCIPSKALLDSTELLVQIREDAAHHGLRVGEVAVDLAALMGRKEQVVQSLTRGVEALFRKRNVAWVRGFGRLVRPNVVRVETADGPVEVEARYVLLAPGSVPAALPQVPVDGERIVDSTGALALPKVPRRLVVIGGGYIGLELGSVWRRLGAEVVVLEAMPTILPQMDAEVVRAAERIFRRQGLDIRTGVRVAGAEPQGEGVCVHLEDGTSLDADVVLVAVGRRANTDGMGFDEVGLKRERGFLVVDEHYRTGVAEVYAIGDAIGGKMLAHKAEEEGIAAVERMAGKGGHVNYRAIPGVVYTWPEIATVGLTEEEARARGPVRVGRFPFAANGRARALGATDGFVKVIADATTDRLLGVHILGPRASDLIAEAALALEFDATAEDLARAVHAHPTLPETLKEAALDAEGRVLHL